MKKTLLYISILANLFINICPMEYKPRAQIEDFNYTNFLAVPNEIKLYIFELLLKNIIENNSIFNPYNNTKAAVSSIALVNKEFYNLKPNLSNFVRKYIKGYFACRIYNLPQKQKDLKLKNIFINMIRNVYTAKSNKMGALEIEAAKLIIAGANPNLLIKQDRFLINGTLLIVIAKTGIFKNLIKLLVKHGAAINIKDAIYGDTALMLAVFNVSEDIIELLIDGKADVNSQNGHGDTALIEAACYGYTNIVQLLISAGANVNAQDNNGHTALIWTTRRGYKDIVKLLIYAGADVNIQDNNGYTALMWAACNGHKSIVELFINVNAAINMQNKYDYTALYLAILHGNSDVAELLKYFGAQ